MRILFVGDVVGRSGRAAVTERLNAETLRALKHPEAAKLLSAQGLEPAPSTPAELAAVLKADIAMYAKIVAGAGIKRGYVHGESDKTASSPAKDPVHPTELLATMYHAFGIDPETIVYNHLNQPRELVKAQAVPALFA